MNSRHRAIGRGLARCEQEQKTLQNICELRQRRAPRVSHIGFWRRELRRDQKTFPAAAAAFSSVKTAQRLSPERRRTLMDSMERHEDDAGPPSFCSIIVVVPGVTRGAP